MRVFFIPISIGVFSVSARAKPEGSRFIPLVLSCFSFTHWPLTQQLKPRALHSESVQAFRPESEFELRSTLKIRLSAESLFVSTDLSKELDSTEKRSIFELEIILVQVEQTSET